MSRPGSDPCVLPFPASPSSVNPSVTPCPGAPCATLTCPSARVCPLGTFPYLCPVTPRGHLPLSASVLSSLRPQGCSWLQSPSHFLELLQLWDSSLSSPVPFPSQVGAALEAATPFSLGVPQQHHGAVRGHLLLPELITVIVTSPKCSLPPSAPLAACQIQLCHVKMWKNTGALCPQCPRAPQPVTARASSPQPLLPQTCVSGLPYTLGSSVASKPCARHRLCAELLRPILRANLWLSYRSCPACHLHAPGGTCPDLPPLPCAAPIPSHSSATTLKGTVLFFYMALVLPLRALAGAAPRYRSQLFPLLGPAGASQAPPGRFWGFLPPPLPHAP